MNSTKEKNMDSDDRSGDHLCRYQSVQCFTAHNTRLYLLFGSFEGNK